MKRLFIKSVLATVTLAAMGLASAQDIKERTLKFGLNSPEGHPAVAGMKKFKETVEAKSGGKIKVQLFLNGTLGSDQATHAFLAFSRAWVRVPPPARPAHLSAPAG